jgi:heparan-alpha-glucosaminide N-acetyltransferase
MMTRIRRRLASIDALRAITMLLMIFVNDLELDEKVPRWLEHAKEGEDRLGLADTVFPAFLFIVGLSIPFAIQAGEAKGMKRRDTILHILRRSFALLVMGIYAVNYEEYTTGPAILGKYAWLLTATIAFFLIWLVYPAAWSRLRKSLFRGTGILLLVVLALIYRGGSPEHPMWMKTHWYGILGLIGWCYLVCALLYFFIRERLVLLGVCFVFFVFGAISYHTGWLRNTFPSDPALWFVDSGGLAAFTMAGVVVAVFYRKWTDEGKPLSSLAWLVALAPVLLVAGFALRPLGGIAKLGVTPSWILICTAISVVCFALLAYVIDLKGQQNWYAWIRPAGTSTLVCYLLTYIHYSILKMLPESWRLPLVLRSGDIALVKSLVFSLLIVWLTGVLEKRKILLSV